MLGFDNRDNLNIVYAWLIGKNESVKKRVGKGYMPVEFHHRHSVTIVDDTNSQMSFKNFQKYDWVNKLKGLEKLKEYLKGLKNDEKIE